MMLQPVMEGVGRVAGAAVLALRDGRAVQLVDVGGLQERLRDRGAVLAV